MADMVASCTGRAIVKGSSRSLVWLAMQGVTTQLGLVYTVEGIPKEPVKSMPSPTPRLKEKTLQQLLCLREEKS